MPKKVMTNFTPPILKLSSFLEELEEEVSKTMKILEVSDRLIAKTSIEILNKLSSLNYNLTMIELKINNEKNLRNFDTDLSSLCEEVLKVNNILKKILLFENKKMNFLMTYHNKNISKKLKDQILEKLNNKSNEITNSKISDLIKKLTENIKKISEKFPQAFLNNYPFEDYICNPDD